MISFRAEHTVLIFFKPYNMVKALLILLGVMVVIATIVLIKTNNFSKRLVKAYQERNNTKSVSENTDA